MHLTYDVRLSTYDGDSKVIVSGCETPHEALGLAIQYAVERMKKETLSLAAIGEWLENPLTALYIDEFTRYFPEDMGGIDAGKRADWVSIHPSHTGRDRYPGAPLERMT